VRSLADKLPPRQYSSFRCLGRQWLDFASEAQSIPVQTSCFGIPATALAMRLTLASTPAFALASTLGLDNACFWVGNRNTGQERWLFVHGSFLCVVVVTLHFC
jgi:hypothetical protein